MKTLLGLYLLSAVLAIPAVCSAASFDSDRYCKQVANAAGGSYQIEKGCLELERESAAKLRAMSVPARVENYCKEVADAAGGSYQIMAGCVEMELEAKGQLGQ